MNLNEQLARTAIAKATTYAEAPAKTQSYSILDDIVEEATLREAMPNLAAILDAQEAAKTAPPAPVVLAPPPPPPVAKPKAKFKVWKYVSRRQCAYPGCRRAPHDGHPWISVLTPVSCDEE